MRNLNDEIESKTIRVFLSSTFLDMQMERTDLIRRVFPHLRSLARGMGVDFTEVDLRWGIPDEDVETGMVLRRCLKEIDECRAASKELPFFVGILGGRYGWIPKAWELAGDKELFKMFPEVEEYLVKTLSVTEMEIRHAVLDRIDQDPVVRNQSYFFFRDPAFTAELKRLDSKSVYVDEDDTNPTFSDREKLQATKQLCSLKTDIASKMRDHAPVVYRNLDELGKFVIEAFEAFLKDHFMFESKGKVGDPDLDDSASMRREEDRNQALFAQSRTKVYQGGVRLRQTIGDVLEAGRPVLITGGVGSGKTALLANFIKEWQDKPGGPPVLYHFCGGTKSSDKLDRMLRRLIGALRLQVGLDANIAEGSSELAFAMQTAIWGIPSSSPLLLVIDGLDQLDTDGDLKWLPPKLPAHVRVMVGLKTPIEGKEHALIALLEGRGFARIQTEILDSTAKSSVVDAILHRYGKSMTSVLCNRVVTCPIADNPLALRALVEEIRLIGDHKNLESQTKIYLDCKHPEEFFDEVVARISGDFPNGEDVMALIGASCDGLAEQEILGIMNLNDSEGRKFPVVRWSALREVLRPHLKEQDGRLTWFHGLVEASVSRRFLSNEEKTRSYRVKMIEYFSKQPRDPHCSLSLIRLLELEGETECLRDALLDIDRFLTLFDSGHTEELQAIWRRLATQRELGAPYADAIRRWEEAKVRPAQERAIALIVIGNFLNRCLSYFEAEIMLRRAFEILGTLSPPDNGMLSFARSSLGSLYLAMGRFNEAEPHLRASMDLLGTKGHASPANYARTLTRLGHLYHEMGRLSKAEDIYRQCLGILEDVFGQESQDVADALNNLGSVCLETPSDRPQAGLLLRRSLAIWEHTGKDNPGKAVPLNNLGYLRYLENRLDDAERLYKESLRLSETAFGPENAGSAMSRNNLGEVYRVSKRYNEAESEHSMALAVREKILAPDHPHTAQSLNNLGLLRREQGRYEEAESLFRKALLIRERSLPEHHPNVAESNTAVGVICNQLKRYDEAETYLRRALKLREDRLGKSHKEVAETLLNLYMVCFQVGRYEEAESQLSRAMLIFENELGPTHATVVLCKDHLSILRSR